VLVTADGMVDEIRVMAVLVSVRVLVVVIAGVVDKLVVSVEDARLLVRVVEVVVSVNVAEVVVVMVRVDKAVVSGEAVEMVEVLDVLTLSDRPLPQLQQASVASRPVSSAQSENNPQDSFQVVPYPPSAVQ